MFPFNYCETIALLQIRTQLSTFTFVKIVQALLDEVLKRKEGQLDILEINKLRRQLLFHSLYWNQRIEFIKLFKGNGLPSETNIETMEKKNSFTTRSESTRDRDSKSTLFTSISLSEDSGSAESSLVSRRTMSDGHFPMFNSNNNNLGGTPDRLPLSKELTEAKNPSIPRANDPSPSLMMPFSKYYSSLNKKFRRYNPPDAKVPVQISVSEWLGWPGGPGGPRFFLPIGVNDMVIPVFEKEPTSVISYALASQEYHDILSNNSRQVPSPDINFADNGPQGKVCYTVRCYSAKCFSSLRQKSSISEQDFIRSLSRCKNWEAYGGKSKVFFAKSLDDRFVIKQLTKTELGSFDVFGPAYFKYVSDSIDSNSPTCLAKIYGIYQVMHALDTFFERNDQHYLN